MKFLTALLLIIVIVNFSTAAPHRRQHHTAPRHGQYVNVPRPQPRPDPNAITRYRIFKNREQHKNIFEVPHHGIQVKTLRGQELFIHKGPAGTTFNEPSQKGMQKSEWIKPQNSLTPEQLRQISGQNYNVLFNNCINARNRMTDSLGQQKMFRFSGC